MNTNENSEIDVMFFFNETPCVLYIEPLMTPLWLDCFRMAHEEGDPAEIAKLTGIGKYFNTLTTKGRVNVSVKLKKTILQTSNDRSRSYVNCL